MQLAADEKPICLMKQFIAPVPEPDDYRHKLHKKAPNISSQLFHTLFQQISEKRWHA